MNRYPIVDEPPYPGIASHIPVLWTMFSSPSAFGKPCGITEFGAGKYSTALLGAFTDNGNIYFATRENKESWMPPVLHRKHNVSGFGNPYCVMPAYDCEWAFVDCEGDKRARVITELLEFTNTGTIIIHDTEPMGERAYKMRGPINRWPYGYVVKCPYSQIHTTVCMRKEPNPTAVMTLAGLSNDSAAHNYAWNRAKLFASSLTIRPESLRW